MQRHSSKVIVIVLALVAAVIAGTIPKSVERPDHPVPHQPKQASFSEKQAFNPEHLSDFWINNAHRFIQAQLSKRPKKTIAKNVIIFMGDGMSMTTLATTRPYIRDENTFLSFEEFPVVGMTKTYCVNYQVPDSACAATALLTGVKNNYGTIGVTGEVQRYDCTAELNQTLHISSIAKWAMDAGKVAGFVTTSSVTDASPAALYAHSANRYWENDVEIRNSGCDPNVLQDIARQLVLNEVGSNMRVILGGGRREFRNTTVLDEEQHYGYRSDGRDLIQEWIELKKQFNSSYVWNAVSLEVDSLEYHFINPYRTLLFCRINYGL